MLYSNASALQSQAAQPHCSLPSSLDARGIIQNDGIAAKRERDPPGYECAYIAPGDHRREEYRIATFAQYPSNCPVLPLTLAKMGFYFTGYLDRVQCFSCGMTVQEWVIGDDVTLPRWHKNSCAMISRSDPMNVPSEFLSLTLENRLLNTRSGNQNIRDVVSGIREVNITEIQQTEHRQREFTFGSIYNSEHERLLKSLDLKREENRRKTFEKWPSYPAPYLPRVLAENGLFYLGNLDRTQCIFCTGVLRNWAPGDNVSEQHGTHFPRCSFVNGGDAVGNVPMSEQARRAADELDNVRLRRQGILSNQDAIVEPPDPSEEEKRRLARLYPLDTPLNPHMASYNQRLQTFQSGWPNHTRAAVEQIAKAGFFYLGQSDKTKCFFCNGGLQNWDRNDEPWTEHGKWFPGCAFVIRQKGQEFVRTLDNLHPNLNRPLIRNAVSYNLNLPDIPPTAAPQESVTPASPTSLIEAATGMGFSIDLIQRVLRRKTDQNGRGYSTVEELLEDLLPESHGEQLNTSSSNEAGEHQQPPPNANATESPGTTGAAKRNVDQPSGSVTDVKKTRTHSPTQPGQNEATQEMKESLRVMQESSICKNCHQNVIDVVCIPCGHLALCTECAAIVKKCVVCNIRIRETMKIFRA